MAEGATGGQMRMIYGMARKIGMDNDELHAVVYGLTQEESIKVLSKAQAIRVIDRLNVLAGGDRQIPNRATDAQRIYIHRLAREMGWTEDPNRLRGFLERMAKVSDVRFLSTGAASQIIEAMKSMQRGGRAERRR